MLLDQQTPKTVTTRRRGKYHFPYLDGYSGPAPPDMATITARQDELERQNSASNTTSDHDSALSTGSLDEDSSLESSPEPDPNPTSTNVDPSLDPGIDKPLSTKSPEQPAVLAGADMTVSDHSDPSLGIPDLIFFPEDLAKGRENALKLQACHQAERKAQLTSSEAILAQQNQRVTELQQEVADKDARLNTSEAALAQQTLRVAEFEHELADQKAQRATSEAALGEQRERVADLQQESQRVPELEKEISRLQDRINAEMVKRDLETSALKTSIDEQAKEYEGLLAAKETELKSESRALAKMEAFASALEKKFEIATVDHAATLTPQEAQLHPPPPPPPPPPHAPNEQAGKLKSSLSTLRNAHIRLAGHIRTTTRSHGSLKGMLEKLHRDLEEDEITMRG
ncbi:MAG: hypothetical protein Q9196_004006, partial [Gyalolechia fulgens]